MNAGLYEKLNCDILSDTSTYALLSPDPTKEFQVLLSKLVDREIYLGVLNNSFVEKLYVSHPVVSFSLTAQGPLA